MLPLVQIAVDQHGTKNVQKVYNNRYVYLDNGTEFEICLFNPTEDVISASISINGKRESNVLVLKPGQRVWLDRFLDTKRKLKFDTYTVDGSEEAKRAIAANGIIKVEFHKEMKKPDPITICAPSPDYAGVPRVYYKSSVRSYAGSAGPAGSVGVSGASGPALCSSDVSHFGIKLQAFLHHMTCADKLSDEVVTGRVEAGAKSDQDFVTVDYDFEWNPFCRAELQILPASTKPIEVSDLKVYCKTPRCGRKQKKGEKFCPSCGRSYNE